MQKYCRPSDTDEILVALAKNGDQPAMEALIGKYIPAIKSRAKSYFVKGGDSDDIIQEGMIGLYEAIRDYNSEKNDKFRPFAELCITRQIQQVVTKHDRPTQGPLNNSSRFEAALYSNDDSDLVISVIAQKSEEEPDKYIIDNEALDELKKMAFNGLSDLELYVIRGRLEGKSYKDMASELKCGTKSIDNAYSRAKSKAKRAKANKGRQVPFDGDPLKHYQTYFSGVSRSQIPGNLYRALRSAGQLDKLPKYTTIRSKKRIVIPEDLEVVYDFGHHYTREEMLAMGLPKIFFNNNSKNGDTILGEELYRILKMGLVRKRVKEPDKYLEIIDNFNRSITEKPTEEEKFEQPTIKELVAV
ncbi:MAG: sigma-70 family RNA polymerase sigma factor [Candidatus Aenigmarchaeota archaeon]|nr:sigma-70 family RNA polymerase sigma factor [Candidatus Aenigmarchaeota archaeon]